MKHQYGIMNTNLENEDDHVDNVPKSFELNKMLEYLPNSESKCM